MDSTVQNYSGFYRLEVHIVDSKVCIEVWWILQYGKYSGFYNIEVKWIVKYRRIVVSSVQKYNGYTVLEIEVLQILQTRSTIESTL